MPIDMELPNGVPVLTFAHDLRQPLRAIMLQVQRIQRQDEALSPSTREKLDEILISARKQEELIASVVEYDQAIQHGLGGEAPIALTLVIRTAFNKVDAFRQLQKGAIHFDPATFPAVAVQPGIATVLEKILHNSLKFHVKDEAPELALEACAEHPGMLCLKVIDNGPGIEPQYREAVFEPFKRLHPSSEYPGCGLGLSTCIRLIESIGGTIKFEDREGGRQGLATVMRFPAAE